MAPLARRATVLFMDMSPSTETLLKNLSIAEAKRKLGVLGDMGASVKRMPRWIAIFIPALLDHASEGVVGSGGGREIESAGEELGKVSVVQMEWVAENQCLCFVREAHVVVGVGDFGQDFGGRKEWGHNLGFRKRKLYARGQLIPLPYNSYAH